MRGGYQTTVRNAPMALRPSYLKQRISKDTVVVNMQLKNILRKNHELGFRPALAFERTSPFCGQRPISQAWTPKNNQVAFAITPRLTGLPAKWRDRIIIIRLAFRNARRTKPFIYPPSWTQQAAHA